MQAVTSPACGPAMSRQAPQHAARRKLAAAPESDINSAEAQAPSTEVIYRTARATDGV